MPLDSNPYRGVVQRSASQSNTKFVPREVISTLPRLPSLCSSLAIMYFSTLLFTYLLVRASVWAKSSCRCIPGDSCWPAPAEWDALNRTVGGRLVATVLLAHVCHDPIYNATACEAVKAGWIYPQEQSVAILAPLHINLPMETISGTD